MTVSCPLCRKALDVTADPHSVMAIHLRLDHKLNRCFCAAHEPDAFTVCIEMWRLHLVELAAKGEELEVHFDFHKLAKLTIPYIEMEASRAHRP